MLLKNITLSALAGALILGAGLADAADQVQDKTQDRTRLQGPAADQTQDRTRLRDQIYGSQLMTEQERLQYRNEMHNMKTDQEREAYRLEHHKLMQERAKEKGVALPDEPPTRPGYMGTGGGMGPGGRRR
ncbi:MAG TPA: hypothetical protein VMV48_04495 [Gallionellaceae bacterium]|nr:hypothetical protein [Gallionellaceae bacterium]